MVTHASDRQTHPFPPMKAIDWTNVVHSIIAKRGCSFQRPFLAIETARRIGFVMFSIGNHNVRPSSFHRLDHHLARLVDVDVFLHLHFIIRASNDFGVKFLSSMFAINNLHDRFRHAERGHYKSLARWRTRTPVPAVCSHVFQQPLGPELESATAQQASPCLVWSLLIRIISWLTLVLCSTPLPSQPGNSTIFLKEVLWDQPIDIDSVESTVELAQIIGMYAPPQRAKNEQWKRKSCQEWPPGLILDAEFTANAHHSRDEPGRTEG
jgi:hypothetical protein